MQHKPSDYRMMAEMCVAIANGMSLDTDRLRLTDRAQEWLELAQKTEAEQLPKNADGGSLLSVESETQKTGEDERLAGSAQTTLEAQIQIDDVEPVQEIEDEQLPEITDGRHAGSVQSLELQTQPSGKSRTRTDFGGEDLEMNDDPGTVATSGTPQFDQSTSSAERDDRRAGNRSLQATRAWSMLCSVLFLAVLALFLTALFAWGP
jgi:hypothetical protein